MGLLRWSISWVVLSYREPFLFVCSPKGTGSRDSWVPGVLLDDFGMVSHTASCHFDSEYQPLIPLLLFVVAQVSSLDIQCRR